MILYGGEGVVYAITRARRCISSVSKEAFVVYIPLGFIRGISESSIFLQRGSS